MSGLIGMGADGSAPDLEAVVWTAREAEVRDLTLGVLHCAGPARPSAPGCLSAQEGRPVQELSRAAEHARGLVVGTRGHGGFRGMLLGSVSQGVLHHAYCPVLLVPHRRHQ
ncbi:hypothetical protein SUDANB9_07009 [Streptomyces sp. enrichment culture]